MDNREKIGGAKNSNSGEDQNWLLFDRTFKFKRKGVERIFIRVALAKELWFHTLHRVKPLTNDEVIIASGNAILQGHKPGDIDYDLALLKNIDEMKKPDRRRLYKIFSIDVEEDIVDPTLKLYSVTLFGFVVNLGFV